ncbi:hypothetical protein RchiOBHm_Chr2g0116021 [Rosa chinensis]|uniref:Uncharacterized protein n=1 Tax=Rosa chinensis TaxID=74649 RepID=A0A2P6RR53_ROSCH|nr:hypothetical protein RchiOBHm_Chr2g0116021 [Rosa chinensis]
MRLPVVSCAPWARLELLMVPSCIWLPTYEAVIVTAVVRMLKILSWGIGTLRRG